MFDSRFYKDDLQRICQVYYDLDQTAKSEKVVTKRYLVKMGNVVTFASDMRVSRLPHMTAFVDEFDCLHDWDGDNVCFTWYIVPISTVSPLVGAQIDVDI